MSVSIRREYRLKFYLNAQHYVVFNGVKGEAHPHTWEFVLSIRTLCDAMTPFHVYEQGINAYLAGFQDTILNDTPTFAQKQPSLEGIVETFASEFDRIVCEKGGSLCSVEGSEGPTRSYIVYIDDDSTARLMEERLENDVIDAVIDEALR